MVVTRFAPSPTGYLHLGHAYSALFAASKGARFLLRIEDIDPLRCKPEFTDAIIEDLGWLGLCWEQPVRKQAEHLADYAAALDILKGRGLVYPCFCTRREIILSAPHSDDAEVVYPGTCRHLTPDERADKMAQHRVANWRLDVAAALRETGALFWHDAVQGKLEAQPQIFGDVVLARKDVPTSYHLSVVVDDYLQGVGLVTRGVDLFTSTHVHRLLQALLGYNVSDYHHHELLNDKNGRRFAKRDQSVTLRALRAQGMTSDDIKRLLPE